MAKHVDGAITAPKGFQAAGVRCGIKQNGADLALIYSEKQCSVAGVFTTNAFKAASVVRNAEKLRIGRGRAIVVNSGNANACTGDRGRRDVDYICKFTAELLNVPEDEVYNASTGIIGVPLPIDKIEVGLMDAVAELAEDGGPSAAKAIMTTDTRPKMAAYEFEIDGTPVRIGAICKGAGMICPNMATMLCFVTTDAVISPVALRKCLLAAVDSSLNCLTVDGDMSTNDCVIAFANGASGCPEIKEGTPAFATFEAALSKVCREMAVAIAVDGEGATKYVEVHVVNAESYADAKTAAMRVANSPLVKTAIFGEDPNWGRVLCAVGESGAKVVPERTSLWFGDVKIVENGEPLNIDAAAARQPMLANELRITVDLGLGSKNATVFTCDFSYDYVKINAEYHT